MIQKELSVEYAHIYTNQRIGEEHKLSVAELKQALSIYPRNDISLCVMIDDYSFPDPTFNYAEFVDWLAGKGYKPDIVLRESQLIPVCDEVLKLIPNNIKLKREVIDYIKSKRYPCSLFVAAWYLLRLGYVKNPLLNSDQIAKNILNILPESFKPFEKMGLEIIKATPHKDAISKIDYKWLEGRLIA